MLFDRLGWLMPEWVKVGSEGPDGHDKQDAE
jgi:hypothetical protein